LQPGGDIHLIAKYIAIPLDDVPGVNANPCMNLLDLLLLSVMGMELGLDLRPNRLPSARAAPPCPFGFGRAATGPRCAAGPG